MSVEFGGDRSVDRMFCLGSAPLSRKSLAPASINLVRTSLRVESGPGRRAEAVMVRTRSRSVAWLLVHVGVIVPRRVGGCLRA